MESNSSFTSSHVASTEVNKSLIAEQLAARIELDFGLPVLYPLRTLLPVIRKVIALAGQLPDYGHV
jgi:hypothetical protein